MNLRLLSLVFAPFALGTSAFVFVGLISPMADDLGVGVPVLGQLQTVFAIACAIGGPILARVLSGYDRKLLLIGVLAILITMNVASTLANEFSSIATIRFAGGLFAALTLPLASTIAVNMVPEVKRPKALATVLAGYTLAFLIGMPMGSILGDAYGWRAAFWFAASVALLALVVIAIVAPRHITAPQMAGVNFKSAVAGDNKLLMLITMFGFLATFATVAFIGPVITKTTGLTGAAIGGVQVATGIGSLLGLPVGVFFARLPVKKALSILLSVTFITQTLFTIGMLYDLDWVSLPLLVVGMTLGSASLFAISPIIQSRLAETAGAAATIAFALNGSMIYVGQGLGATLGGSVTAATSLAWVGAAGATMAIFGLIAVWRLQTASVFSEL